jgi:DNA replication and repair protein RecF
MTISSLALVNFRNIKRANLQLSPTLNLFKGVNGAGKTSVLEALYYSLTGKSFRTRSQSDYINRHREDDFETKIKVEFANSLTIDDVNVSNLIVEIKRGRQSRSNVINGGLDTVSRFSNITQKTPCFYFSPESLNFLSGEPQSRRSFTDWLLFHVEPSYRDLHLQFKQVLKNRNAILGSLKRAKKKGHSDVEHLRQQLGFWTNQYIEVNMEICRLRDLHLTKMFEQVQDIASSKFHLKDLHLQITHYLGWSGSDLSNVIREQSESEEALGYSLSGIHKADIVVSGTDGIRGKFIFSRGQTKLVTLCFVIAAVEYIKFKSGNAVLLLLDDIYSELDRLNSEKVSVIIAQLQEHQILLTSAEHSLSFTDVHLDSLQHQAKMFHVEQGEFIEEK